MNVDLQYPIQIRRSGSLLAAFGAFLATLSLASAQTTGTWNVDTAGNWSAATNWTDLTAGLAPNAVGATAALTFNITVDRAITLDTDTTLGALTITDDSHRYILNMAAGRTLTFDAASGNASIAVTGATTLGNRIGQTAGQGTIQLNDNLNITVGSGANTFLTLNSRVSGTGALIANTLNSTDGTGTAVNGGKGLALSSTVANDFSGGVTINSGFVRLNGNIGNLGSGNLTLNASDGTNGGIGSHLALATGGGTLANNIIFGNTSSTGTNPRLGIYGVDTTGTNNYIFTGNLSGDLSGQTLRFFESSTGAATFRLQGSGSGLITNASTSIAVRKGSLILDNANAIGTGNNPGTAAGAWAIGNATNASTGTAALLTNGYDVGGNIQFSQVTDVEGGGNNDNNVVGGIHTSGSATFTGQIQMSATTTGSTRVAQFTSAAGGITIISGAGGAITDGGTTLVRTRLLPVVKIGDGTVIFSRALGNTYTGGTTVSAGTLLVNNTSNSGTGTGAVSVSSGATLGGTGRLSGATTNSGDINAGNGAGNTGTLTFGGGLNFNSGSKLVWEINDNSVASGFDSISLTEAI
jgi:fibronectin-binding autotransporter adhesin